ncbi:taurine dioxygenase [Pseudomonas aeruginosa]|nr:taurine dioxygenase [Pseudomonas aeruginosa]
MCASRFGSNQQPTRFEVIPLQPSLGAEVRGLNLAGPITPELAAFLRETLQKYRVIFLRDQSISREQHVALGRVWGTLEVHPIFQHPDHPEILPLIAKEGAARYRKTADGNWHADTTFRPEPSAVSVLRAIVSPSLGGDTVFANAVDAYELLPDRVKERIEGLTAIHDPQVFLQFVKTQEEQRAILEAYPEVEHPVVRLHPETGEKVLYVNSIFTRRIVGLASDESDKLLKQLFDQVKRPEFQVRWTWRPDSIAIWDNRATQHYAVPDYTEPRHMERVTAIGDRPVGIYGL